MRSQLTTGCHREPETVLKSLDLYTFELGKQCPKVITLRGEGGENDITPQNARSFALAVMGYSNFENALAVTIGALREK